MKLKKAIVTGGAGFIGSHLVDKLIDMGVEVHVIDDLSTGKKENINPNANFHKETDISKLDPYAYHWEFGKDVDIIFHLAALARVQPSIEQPIPYHDVNVTGTHNLLIWAQKNGVKRFVFSSSSSVYGDTVIFPTPEDTIKNPMSPYAMHKLIGEQYCKLFSTLYDIDTVSLRYFNVYGDRMNLEGAYRLAIPIFASQIKEGKPCTINNDGKQRRDFTYVVVVVDSNIICASNKKRFSGDVFNIGNGNNTSVNELVDMLGGERGKGIKVVEPFETLADNAKALLDLYWDPKGNLENWIKKYRKELGI